MPVAGGFAEMDQAIWGYRVVLHVVQARLADLEAELFYTLHVDIEEDYVLDQGSR